MNHRYPPPQRDHRTDARPPRPTGARPAPQRRAVPAPAARVARLPVPPPSHRAGQHRPAPERRRTATALLDHPTAPLPVVAPRIRRDDSAPAIDLVPGPVARSSSTEDLPSRSRRLTQAALVAVLGAVAAGIAFSLPNDRSGEQAGSGSTTRVETDGPTASASLLASDDRLEIEGELTDAGQLAQGRGLMIRIPSPTGSVALDAAEMTNLVEPAGDLDQGTPPEGSTTTTTAWVEPTLPPESEWVDTGHGVLVPDLLLRIRFCESTNNYTAASPYSTARGAYQFLSGSWDWYGHAERTGVAQAHLATPAQQDQAALRTLQAEGTGPWSESRPCWADPDIDPRYATAAPPTTAAPTTTSPPTTGTTNTSGSTETTVGSSSTTTTASTTSEPSTTSTTDTTTPSTTDSTSTTTS